MTATNETILKTDRRGRLRYSAEQKATLVAAFQTSGLSGPHFAAIHGVKYQTLATWLQKRRKSERSAGSSELSHPAFLSLVPAELHAPPPSGAPMEILLPGGTKLAINLPGQIPLAAALIRELENPRPC
jgi:transposase-like protein